MMSSLLLVADYGASSGSEDDTDITTHSPVRCVNTWSNYTPTMFHLI